MTFQEKLNRIVKKNNSLVCVGLDSDLAKIPSYLKNPPSSRLRRTREKNPIFEFNKAIIETTADFVCAYKPNVAFYEAAGVEGIAQLKMTFDFLRGEHPEIVTILDAKRADIGSTNQGYVKFAFDYLGADSITVHPYLGQEAFKPFLERVNKGIFVLCRTSNSGAGEFQDLLVDGVPLYQVVAHHVVEKWNVNGNCMLVLGATYPQELAEVRKIVGDMTLLVPGVGAQGAGIKKTVEAGLNSKNAGIIIPSSRGIIFARDPREETKKLRDEINKYR